MQTPSRHPQIFTIAEVYLAWPYDVFLLGLKICKVGNQAFKEVGRRQTYRYPVRRKYLLFIKIFFFSFKHL